MDGPFNLVAEEDIVREGDLLIVELDDEFATQLAFKLSVLLEICELLFDRDTGGANLPRILPDVDIFLDVPLDEAAAVDLFASLLDKRSNTALALLNLDTLLAVLLSPLPLVVVLVLELEDPVRSIDGDLLLVHLEISLVGVVLEESLSFWLDILVD